MDMNTKPDRLSYLDDNQKQTPKKKKAFRAFSFYEVSYSFLLYRLFSLSKAGMVHNWVTFFRQLPFQLLEKCYPIPLEK
jgi:hypothetical protein